MREKKYKVIVRGGYGLTNFGDDALLKSIHENYLFHFSPSELGYSSTQKDYFKKDIQGYDSLPLNIDYENLTHVLLYGGGTQFYSFKKKRPFLKRIFCNLPLIFKPKKFWNKVKLIIKRSKDKSIKKDISTMALGIGVGPFLPSGDPLVEKKVASLFQKMRFVAVRDIYSYRKCQEWGLQNFGLYADLCFLMDHNKFFIFNPKSSANNIGIIVRDWNQTEEGNLYKDKILAVAGKLKEQQKKVDFIIFAKDKDQKWLKLLTKRKENIVLWDPDINNINSFFNTLSNYDLFITARYHGAVFSTMLGKPFITIELEQKLSMFQEIFSESSYNWQSPFAEKDILEKIHMIEENYRIFSEKVVKTAQAQRQLALKMQTDLHSQLEKELQQ